MQRRFQLVRDIGGELAPQLLGLFLFGRVEHKKYDARDLVAGRNGACVEPVAHAAEGDVCLAVLAAERFSDDLVQLRCGAERKDVLSDAVAAYIEDLGRRLVDAQDTALLVQKH